MADDRWEDISNVDYYNDIQTKIPGVRFTSGYRTPEYQADMKRRGYHPAQNSGHLKGEKMDLLPPEGKSMSWLKSEVQKHYPYAQINQNEGDHADVRFPGWTGAPALGGAKSAGVSNPNRQTGPLVPGNIDIHNRPVVHNPDGTISTVRSISIGTDQGEVLIPTVSPDGKILSDEDAIKLYKQTGQHLGIFSTPDEATAYAESLHNEQAQEYGNKAPAADDPNRWEDVTEGYQASKQAPQDYQSYHQPGEAQIGINDPLHQAAIIGLKDEVNTGKPADQIIKEHPEWAKYFPKWEQELPAAVDYARGHPGVPLGIQGQKGSPDIVAEGHPQDESAGHAAAASLADATTGLGTGLGNIQGDAVHYGAKLTDALGITQGEEDRVRDALGVATDLNNEQFVHPDGWSRAAGELVGEGAALAPLLEVAPFAAEGKVAKAVIDPAIQGGIGGAATSPDNPVEGTAAGALLGAGLGSVIDAAAEGLGGHAPDVAAEATESAPKAPRTTKRQAAAQAEVDRTTAGWTNKPDIEVVDTVKKIKDPELRQKVIDDGAEHDATGFVDKDGKVYIVAANHANSAEVQGTLFHEALGHKGLDNLFKEAKDTELARLYDGNAKLRTEVDDWMERNGHTLADDTNPLARGIEEVLAERSEKGQLDPRMLARLKQTIRQFARKMGLTIDVSDNEVMALLGMAHRTVTKGKAGQDVATDGLRYMYGGRKAADTEGKDFFTGPDGKDRFEFSDEGHRLNDRWEELPSAGAFAKTEETNLGEVFDHPELYKQYPEAADIKVTKKDAPFDLWRSVQGSFDPETNRLNITPYAQDKESTVLHEVQHWIQQHEGFAKGGNPHTAIAKQSEDQLYGTTLKARNQWSTDSKSLETKIAVFNHLREMPEVKAWMAAEEHFNDFVKMTRSEDWKINEEDTAAARTQKFKETAAAKEVVLEKLFGVKKPWELKGPDRETWSQIDGAVSYGQGLDHAIEKMGDDLQKIKTRVDDLDYALESEDKDLLTKTLASDDKIAMDTYKSLFGEVEARDTQRRRNLSDEERATNPRYQPLQQEVIPEGKGWESVEGGTVDTDHVSPEDYVFDMDGGDSSENRYARKSTKTPKEEDRTGVDKFVAGNDIKKFLRDMNKNIPEKGTRTRLETNKLARVLDINPKDIKILDDAHVKAAREAVLKSARNLKTLSTRIANGEDSTKMLEQFAKGMSDHLEVQSLVAEMRTAFGRGLRQFRDKVHSQARTAGRYSLKGGQAEGIEGILGNAKSLREVAEILAGKSEDEIAGTVRKIMDPKFEDYIMSWTLNSMFSGPNTHINNAKGNALAFGSDILLESALHPSEAGSRFAGAVTGFRNLFKEVEVEGLNGEKRITNPLAEAWRMGESMDHVSKIEKSNIVFKGKLGTAIEWPKKALAAGDEFWKSIIKASEIRGLAVRTAIREGADDVSARAQELIDNPTEQMLEAARQKQAQLTFLDEPTWLTKKFLQATHASPKDGIPVRTGKLAARMVVPIVRTPERLAAWALRWSPAGVLSKDFKAGGLRRRTAIGKITVGSLFYAYGVNKFADDELTGSMSTYSASKRKELMAQGIKPYSIKIGDKWYSYQGWDPVSIPLSLIAEGGEAISKYSDQDIASRAAHAIVGVAGALVSSTWMENVKDALSATNQNGTDYAVWTTLGNIASRFIPYSAMLRQGQDYVDDTIYDKSGDRTPADLISGQLKNTIPGARQTMPEMHDVYGRTAEKVNPTETDPTVKELTRLSKLSGKPLVGAMQREKGESAKDYQIKQYYGGQYTVAAARDFINSPEYKGMSDADRYKEIKSIVRKMHKLAKETASQADRWEEVN